MSTQRLMAFSVAVLIALLASARSAMPQDRFWLLWEQNNCAKSEECKATPKLSGRLMPPEDTASLHQLFGALTAGAAFENRPADNPEMPRLCPITPPPEIVFKADSPASAATYDAQPMSERIDALHGVTKVGLDLVALKGPPEEMPGFGAALQEAFSAKLAAVGVTVIAPVAAAELAGQPQLKLFFSFSSPDNLCQYTYSVFATLTQTAVLTRDTSVKLEAGVWSHQIKGSEPGGEVAMLLGVATAFSSDWQRANQSAIPRPVP